MWFYMLDAVFAIVIGGVFGWYWGLAIVAFGMFCVWLGATGSASVKQRNYARGLLLQKSKPVPLANRVELIKAIYQMKETVREVIWRNDILKTKREIGDTSESEQALVDYSTAYRSYDEAGKQLECEISVAGEAFRKPITLFQNTVKLYVLSREIANAPDYTEILTRLQSAVDELVGEIDMISRGS